MPENTKQNLDHWSTAGQRATGKLGMLWCDLMHDSPMWPIHGRYECRTCGRRYAVPWADNRLLGPAFAKAVPHRPARVPSALLPLMILLAVLLASTSRASDAPLVSSTAVSSTAVSSTALASTAMSSTAGASLAFARYTASLEQASPWGLETVDIEASLPKLAKGGRLRAIRRLLPLGRPEYQVLEIAGDSTVKQQVIVRYLSADVRAAAIPPCLVAITPANYRFRYKGAVKTGEAVAYAFLITPRQKREGLIKGELWLDAETGSIVRQSGYLVKRPSIFVKRVDVTRETALRGGIAEMRVTHLSIDTRLVGRAELTIRERPFDPSDQAAALNIEER
jgi:hypothetical protein